MTSEPELAGEQCKSAGNSGKKSSAGVSVGPDKIKAEKDAQEDRDDEGICSCFFSTKHFVIVFFIFPKAWYTFFFTEETLDATRKNLKRVAAKVGEKQPASAVVKNSFKREIVKVQSSEEEPEWLKELVKMHEDKDEQERQYQQNPLYKGKPNYDSDADIWWIIKCSLCFDSCLILKFCLVFIS